MFDAFPFPNSGDNTGPQPFTPREQIATARRGHIHIDRITVTGPLNHEPIGPLFFKEVPDSFGLGELLPAGSQAYKPTVRKTPQANDIFAHSKLVSADGSAQKLSFDCCPPQVLQGHNLLGHSDLAAYVYEIFKRQLDHHGLTGTREEHEWWRTGRFVTLTGLHLTGNHWCAPALKALIFDAVDQNNPSGKKRDCETSITLGITPKGERSKYHSLTIYDKLMLLIKEWPTPGPKQRELMQLAERSLRVEIKLYAQWLNTYAVDPLTREIANYRVALKRDPALAQRLLLLSNVSSWMYVDVEALFYKLLGSYNVKNSIQRVMTEDEATQLSRRARIAYTLWLKGEDLTKHYGRSARSTYAREIWEKVCVDISSRRRPERLPEVHLADILCPEQLVPVPECIMNTPYYWIPAQ